MADRDMRSLACILRAWGLASGDAWRFDVSAARVRRPTGPARPAERDQVCYSGKPVHEHPDGSRVEPASAWILHGQASDLAFVIQGNPSDAVAGFEGQREFNYRVVAELVGRRLARALEAAGRVGRVRPPAGDAVGLTAQVLGEFSALFLPAGPRPSRRTVCVPGRRHRAGQCPSTIASTAGAWHPLHPGIPRLVPVNDARGRGSTSCSAAPSGARTTLNRRARHIPDASQDAGIGRMIACCSSPAPAAG
jgi:hypothetical protein